MGSRVQTPQERFVMVRHDPEADRWIVASGNWDVRFLGAIGCFASVFIAAFSVLFAFMITQDQPQGVFWAALLAATVMVLLCAVGAVRCAKTIVFGNVCYRIELDEKMVRVVRYGVAECVPLSSASAVDLTPQNCDGEFELIIRCGNKSVKLNNFNFESYDEAIFVLNYVTRHVQNSSNACGANAP